MKGEIDLEDFIMRFEGFIDVEVKDGVATIEELERSRNNASESICQHRL